MIDVFEESIIFPSEAICLGCDYRVPMMHGLLEKRFVNKLKMSPSYDEQTFAKEYLSVWEGSSEDSWFKFDKLQKYRKLKNPETHASNRVANETFYLLSVDVGRLHDQTVCCVYKIRIYQGRYYAALVNIYVFGRTIESKVFSRQAIDIKKVIQAFDPKEVVLDTNGLGVGLADEMIKEQIDTDGTVYPAYGFHNDADYKKVQPKGVKNILYGIKATSVLKPKIHSNAYSRLDGGLVKFLIKETEAKSALLATQKGQKMSVEARINRLMPHEMTTKLFEEMSNLRLKKTGNANEIILEQINSRFPDDKYFAFAYGLWRIKELEEEGFTRQRRRLGSNNSAIRQLTFYTGD